MLQHGDSVSQRPVSRVHAHNLEKKRDTQKRERRPRMDLSPANIARLEHVLRTLDFTQGADA